MFRQPICSICFVYAKLSESLGQDEACHCACPLPGKDFIKEDLPSVVINAGLHALQLPSLRRFRNPNILQLVHYLLFRIGMRQAIIALTGLLNDKPVLDLDCASKHLVPNIRNARHRAQNVTFWFGWNGWHALDKPNVFGTDGCKVIVGLDQSSRDIQAKCGALEYFVRRYMLI